MGLTASEGNTGTKFPPVRQGLHVGLCYGVLDLGTQYQERWNKYIHKIIIIWELPNERIDIEKDGDTKNLPRALSKQYTLSLHEKANLRKDLESWRGKAFTEDELKGFNVFNVLTIPCQLNVIHTKKGEKEYANISTIVPAANMSKKQPENPILRFSFEEWPDMNIPEPTPSWIVDIIKGSDEYRGITRDTEEDSPTGPDPDDDIPF